jgi:hypothetical protein
MSARKSAAKKKIESEDPNVTLFRLLKQSDVCDRLLFLSPVHHRSAPGDDRSLTAFSFTRSSSLSIC